MTTNLSIATSAISDCKPALPSKHKMYSLHACTSSFNNNRNFFNNLPQPIYWIDTLQTHLHQTHYCHVSSPCQRYILIIIYWYHYITNQLRTMWIQWSISKCAYCLNIQIYLGVETIATCHVGKPPDFGTMSKTVGEVLAEGETVTYTCNLGYVLVGSEFSTCQDKGHLFPIPPECVPDQSKYFISHL